MKRMIWLMAFFIAFMAAMVGYSEQVEAKSITYTITPTKKPVDKSYKFKNYNSSTKHFYLLNSYLNQIEKNGGGTLVLKKGTYTISNVLNIPSNTTIKLENGVILKKGMTTGKASFKHSQTLFQLVTPKSASKKGVMKKYNGAKNIKILGYGKAIIDLNNGNKATAINMAHANNILISGIEFKNNNNATMIHVVGSQKVNIAKNKFLNAKTGTTHPTIRLETAAKTSSVYPMAWSANDNTVNKVIKISSNTFTAQETAIRTSDYAKGKYQTGIVIDKNRFSKMTNMTIHMTNWDKPIIENNVFDERKTKVADTIIARAVRYPVIKSNTFMGSKNILGFKSFIVNKKTIAKTETKISITNKKELVTNKGTGLEQYFLMLPDDSYVALKNNDPGVHNYYEFNSKSKVLNPAFTRYSTYTPQTKNYFVLRSILERLEMQGGGVLKIKKGVYLITNNLYVPSNVTIELEDGVVLKKAATTGTSKLNISRSIFQLIAPSKSEVIGAVGKHNGTRNVKIYSKGRATIDLQNQKLSFGIVMGHNMNITVQNINFVNSNAGHFIELDASKNVVFDNLSFIGNSSTEILNANEAINLDTPDKVTKGFNAKWSNLDRTGNDGITIKNSHFEDLVTAIGTHQISGEGTINGKKFISQPHKNVKIINNTFENLRSDAIHAFNWDQPIIENNNFKDIHGMNSGIASNGSFYPTFKNNHFENLNRAMHFFPKKNATNGKEYKEVYDKFTATNLADLETNTGTNLNQDFIYIYPTFNSNKGRIIVNLNMK